MSPPEDFTFCADVVGGTVSIGAGVEGANEGVEGVKDGFVDSSACDAGDAPFCIEGAGEVCGIGERKTG
jgi:hypothetical protein